MPAQIPCALPCAHAHDLDSVVWCTVNHMWLTLCALQATWWNVLHAPLQFLLKASWEVPFSKVTDKQAGAHACNVSEDAGHPAGRVRAAPGARLWRSRPLRLLTRCKLMSSAKRLHWLCVVRLLHFESSQLSDAELISVLTMAALQYIRKCLAWLESPPRRCARLQPYRQGSGTQSLLACSTTDDT